MISEQLLNASKNTVLALNIGKTYYMEAGGHQGMMANEHIMVGSNSYENIKFRLHIDIKIILIELFY